MGQADWGCGRVNDMTTSHLTVINVNHLAAGIPPGEGDRRSPRRGRGGNSPTLCSGLVESPALTWPIRPKRNVYHDFLLVLECLAPPPCRLVPADLAHKF